MALRMPGGGGGVEEGAGAALGVAFQQVAQGVARELAQGLARVQEALRQQQDATLGALERRLEERVRSLEGRVAALEAQPPRDPPHGAGGHETADVEQLEGRMSNLEASVQRALVTVFPRVDALVAQLEETAPPGPPRVQSSASSTHSRPIANTRAATATGASAAVGRGDSVALDDLPLMDALNDMAQQASRATGVAAGGVREEPDVVDEEEREKQLVERRVRAVRSRRDRANLDPSSVREELCDAVLAGRLDSVRRYLDAGVRVNYTDIHGNSPLINAVICPIPSKHITSLLLERGAYVNDTDVNGRSPLHLALEHPGFVTSWCVPLLIRARAKVNARDLEGKTPLHLAAYEDNEDAAHALLAAGARKDLRCWRGGWCNETPFDVARSDAVRELLRP